MRLFVFMAKNVLLLQVPGVVLCLVGIAYYSYSYPKYNYYYSGKISQVVKTAFITYFNASTFTPATNKTDDWGYIMSETPFELFANQTSIDFSRIPNNYTITINGDTIYDYSITNPDTGDSTTIKKYIDDDYDFPQVPDVPDVPDPGDDSGTGGKVEVSGKIDVSGKVDVDVNVNVNPGSSSNPDPGDYINPGTVDTNLDGDNTTISLRRVVNAIQDGNLCCKARVWSDQGDDFRKLFSYKASKKRRNGEELEGLTVQLGARQSEQICRFYDKFTEQKMKGNELPEGCTAWTRCEFEYKGGNAMSVFNAYIDYSDKEFAEYMTGSALNFVRFVNRTSDNVSRCEVKRWWKSFLNGATKAVKFNKVKAAKSAFMRFSRGFKKQYLRKLWTVIDVWGWDGLQDWIERSVDEELNKGVVYIDKELQHNLEDGQRYYESFDGFRRFSSCSALSAEELEKNIREQHFDYCKQFYSIVRLGKRPDPQVLYDV